MFDHDAYTAWPTGYNVLYNKVQEVLVLRLY